jgi:hypothetical protein
VVWADLLFPIGQWNQGGREAFHGSVYGKDEDSVDPRPSPVSGSVFVQELGSVECSGIHVADFSSFRSHALPLFLRQWVDSQELEALLDLRLCLTSVALVPICEG